MHKGRDKNNSVKARQRARLGLGQWVYIRSQCMYFGKKKKPSCIPDKRLILNITHSCNKLSSSLAVPQVISSSVTLGLWVAVIRIISSPEHLQRVSHAYSLASFLNWTSSVWRLLLTNKINHVSLEEISSASLTIFNNTNAYLNPLHQSTIISVNTTSSNPSIFI